jgi:hypothetical protein
VQQALRRQGATVQPGTPAQADAFIRSEIGKFANIVKISGTHID